ncbi:hypothetical protein ACI2K4_10640 [Micromonospora sp. NPDC050397]|uniref:hypothetical protein n=1 Tax=Micromonospora sp. NPDC050397 TaxID=3364279 RepID=UPI00384B4F1F
MVVSVAAQQTARRRRRLDPPGLVALVLGLLGLGYRLVLVLLTVPGSNSDEATFGLAAAHIATGREWPIFLYGQHYMGVVESYLAAPLFAAFEPSWVLLRVPLLLLYAAFVYLMYRLTRRLYSAWLATLVVGLLALGSERVIRDQLTAVGGRPEVKPAVALLLLLALALGEHRHGRHRWLTFGLFGLLTGLCVWDDWLILPYLAVAVIVLLVGSARDLLGWAGLLLVGGFVVGVLPLVVDNLTAPPGQDSLSVLSQVSAGEGGDTSAVDQLHGSVLVGVPLATGICLPTACTGWQMAWGALYPLLLVAGAVLAVRCLLRPPPLAAGSTTAGPSPVTRRLRYVTQLALLVGAALTLAGYARSSLAATAPLASARYLSILQLSLPAVLWPLWLTARWALRKGPLLSDSVVLGALPNARRVGGALAGAVLVALAGTMLYTTVALIDEVPTIRAEERRSRELVTVLRQAGISRVYGDYWTCNRLIFSSREQVLCAVLGDRLHPGQNRYPAYVRQVEAAERPAFVFTVHEPADRLIRDLLRERGVDTRVVEFGEYRIYQPSVTVRPPA